MLKDKMVTTKDSSRIDADKLQTEGVQITSSLVVRSISASKLASSQKSKHVSVLGSELPKDVVSVQGNKISSGNCNKREIIRSEAAAKIYNSNQSVSTDSTGRIY